MERAIAVSGLDDNLPGAVEAAVEWVVRLARSPAVQILDPPDYLTVSLPRLPPDQIRGVRVTDRAPLRVVPRLRLEGSTVWRVVGTDEVGPPTPSDSDQAIWEDGYIVVVPMRADEIDFERVMRWRREGVSLPAWGPDGR